MKQMSEEQLDVEFYFDDAPYESSIMKQELVSMGATPV